MSRWISPWAWAAARPEAICAPIRRVASGSSRGPLRGDALGQRHAQHVLHHDVGKPVDFVDRVDRDDVIVADGRGGLGFPRETLAGRGVGGQLRRQDLDRHEAVQARVVGLENDRPSRPARPGSMTS